MDSSVLQKFLKKVYMTYHIYKKGKKEQVDNPKK